MRDEMPWTRNRRVLGVCRLEFWRLEGHVQEASAQKTLKAGKRKRGKEFPGWLALYQYRRPQLPDTQGRLCNKNVVRLYLHD